MTSVAKQQKKGGRQLITNCRPQVCKDRLKKIRSGAGQSFGQRKTCGARLAHRRCGKCWQNRYPAKNKNYRFSV